MKAVRFHRYGDPDVLVYEDVPQPVPGPGEVLVKVAATSFNPVDAGLRAGRLRAVMPLELPHIPCVDLAGTVVSCGPDVTGRHDGDAVVAYLPVTRDGAAAEYALAPASLLTAAPTGVDLTDAAALPGPALSAWQGLFDHGGLVAGQSVLINGAGGTVGGYATQLAHRAGATVTATAGPRSIDRVRDYGAHHILDYTVTPVTEAGTQFDVVFNLVPCSPEEVAALVGLVADGGIFVSATTPGADDPGRGVRAIRMASASKAGQLAELVRRVDAGELRVHVADRRPLAELATVHQLAEHGKLLGRTILLP